MRNTLFFVIFLSISSLYANTEFNPNAGLKECLACNVPDGLLVSDLTGTSALLSWNAVTGASGYTIEVEDEQNNPSTFHIEVNVGTNSYQVTGLQAGVLYKFKVRTRCGGDKSDWSNWMFFTAVNGGGGSANCGVPTGLSVSVVGGVASLGWAAVPGAIKYTIEVEDEQNNPSNFHLEDSSTTNAYTLAGLQTGVLYKFKVRVHCASGQSDWSTWLFFNGSGNGQGGGAGTGACAPPTALAANVNGNSATLSWNKVTDAIQYYLEIEDEQNTPSTFHLELAVQDTAYVLNGLLPGVLYKFKVRSHCASDQSIWSAWLFFNGSAGNGAGGGIGGGSGNCDRPTGTQVSNITASEALLSWNPVPGAASYLLEIEREQAGAAPWQITQMVTTNSFLLTGLNADTRYKFKVRSNCTGGGHSNWTKWRKFKTAPSFSDPSGGNMQLDPTDDRAENIVGPLQVAVWPNPAHVNPRVRLQNLSAEPTQLRLFDFTGRLLQEQHVRQEGSTCELEMNTSGLSNGTYILQIQHGSQTHNTKLVIVH